MITTEIINSSEKFYAMREEWNALLEKSGVKNPYLTHEWFSSWWKGYGSDKKLFTIAIKDNDECAGFAPMMKYKTKLVGIPIEAIGFISNHWSGSDFLIKDANKSNEVVAKILECMLKERRIIILSYFNQNSNAYLALDRILKTQRIHHSYTTKDALYINLEGTWQDYLKKRTSSFRDESKKKRKRLEKLGVLEFSRFRGNFDIDKVLNDVKTVSDQSWQNKKGVAILSTQNGIDFYKKLTEEWLKKNVVDISLLKLNQKAIAYQVGFQINGGFCAFETAYCEEYHDFSPGMVVINTLLEQMFAEQKIKRFDFGLSADYKRRWTDTSNHILDVTIFPNTIKGFALKTASRIKNLKRNPAKL